MTAAGDAVPFEQRVESDGLIIEFEVDTAALHYLGGASEKAGRLEGRAQVEADIARLDEEHIAVDRRVDQLTNQADGFDYTIAAASGALAGIVDSLWVGELSLERSREWGSQLVNRTVMQAARKEGYSGNDLAGAIRKLEQKYPFAGDKAIYDFGGGTIHHLRDLSHHPSPVGLVASIVMQFTGQAWGVSDGSLSPVDVADSGLIGTTVPEKLLFGTVRWALHLLSDAAGSSHSAGAGTGLPGPLLATLHEAASLLEGIDLGDQRVLQWIEGVFRGDGGGVPFDLRTELGLGKEFGRQALPVLLNEALVRAFFFITRTVAAIREAKPKTLNELVRVDLVPALPWRNRTIVRMLTIATSTFTAIDLVDAAVRAAIESGAQVETPAFWASFVLHVNFVGVVRTSFAIGVDVSQGRKRSKLRNDRIALMNERLHLLDARSFYKLGDVWIAAGEATSEVQVAGQALAAATREFQSIWAGTREISAEIDRDLRRLRAENPELLEQLRKDLEWGGES